MVATFQIHRAPRLLPRGDVSARFATKASKKATAGFVYLSGAVYRRIPLFRYRATCEIFLRALEAYRQVYGLRVHGYAVMPNHYHLLLRFPPDRQLVDFLRDFKSLVGKRILAWIHREKRDRLLRHFELRRSPRRKRDARYCVLQYNNYVKTLIGSAMIRQKLEYIHANPVREGLAATPEEYPYSSARVYAGKGLSWVKIDRLDLT